MFCSRVWVGSVGYEICYKKIRTRRAGYEVLQNLPNLSGTGNSQVNTPGIQDGIPYRTLDYYGMDATWYECPPQEERLYNETL